MCVFSFFLRVLREKIYAGRPSTRNRSGLELECGEGRDKSTVEGSGLLIIPSFLCCSSSCFLCLPSIPIISFFSSLVLLIPPSSSFSSYLSHFLFSFPHPTYLFFLFPPSLITQPSHLLLLILPFFSPHYPTSLFLSRSSSHLPLPSLHPNSFSLFLPLLSISLLNLLTSSSSSLLPFLPHLT